MSMFNPQHPTTYIPQWPKPKPDSSEEVLTCLKQILAIMHPAKLEDVFVIGFNQVTTAMQKGLVQTVLYSFPVCYL